MTPRPTLLSVAFAMVAAVSLSGAAPAPDPMPYAAAGLTAEQAAAHLLSRFGYGARPGEAARVARTGLDRWLDSQLAGRLAELDLDRRLEAFPALAMSAEALARTYPPRGRVATEARAAGVLRDTSEGGRQAYRSAIEAFGQERGYRPERDLAQQLVAQHVVRAAYAENQLGEVMTEFWFNHFNVSAQDGPARPHLLAYERDAVRPNALGRFRDLLGATARHPAMLHYLDNARSTAPTDAATMAPRRRQRARRQRAQPPNPQNRRTRGVNENYARELLELHTLGVDGGYTQADVEAVARAFTGWTVWPAGSPQVERFERLIASGRARGAVRDGLFLFRPDAHDAGAKTILGQAFPAGRGVEDGEAVLDLVAASPATARHIARKLAVRFVSDAPSDALVERLAGVFAETDGDVDAVVRAIAASPEFWSPEAIAGKVRSPFELAVGAVRATGADVVDARGLVQQTEAMGQALYRYPAPTGFPDRAEQWLSAGTVAARVRFGLAFATGGVPGVRLDAADLIAGPLPATTDAALSALAPRVLSPVRPADVDALARLASDPSLSERLEAPTEAPAAMEASGAMAEAPAGRRGRRARAERPRDTTPVAQALGVLLGSPAFQRR